MTVWQGHFLHLCNWDYNAYFVEWLRPLELRCVKCLVCERDGSYLTLTLNILARTRTYTRDFTYPPLIVWEGLKFADEEILDLGPR